jgi:ABC-type lipoprotein release transport system permease subunit
MRLVVAQGLVLTAAGLATGLAGAYLAAPLLRDLPVSIRPPDVVVTAPIAAAVATVSLVACLLPARRACRVNPMAVLRND